MTSQKHRVWSEILGLVLGMLNCSHYHGPSEESHASRAVNEASTRAQLFYV